MPPVPASLRRASAMAVLSALAALAVATPGISAQTSAAEGGHAHPVHVHRRACAELGDVAVPLNDLVAPVGDWTGPESAVPVTLSENVIDVPLQEVTDGGHAINVHLSAEAIDQYIACGDIGGAITTDEGGRREMMIGLAELNDSGYSGTVWLGPSADDTQTEISVILLEPAQ